MKYTEEMILHSESGYCMPFEEPQGKEVEMTLGYGEQTDPGTGKPFFHHGIDFNARYYRLSAVASGIVSGVGNDPVHGICQTIRYGEYEVTYGHLSNVFAQFGHGLASLFLFAAFQRLALLLREVLGLRRSQHFELRLDLFNYLCTSHISQCQKSQNDYKAIHNFIFFSKIRYCFVILSQ